MEKLRNILIYFKHGNIGIDKTEKAILELFEEEEKKEHERYDLKP
jgi:hypothetical protein